MQKTDTLKKLFKDAISASDLNVEADIDPALERPKDESNGDFASTLALRLAKVVGKNPREIAQIIVENFPENSEIKKIEIAGPGFINLHLNDSSISEIVNVVRTQKLDFAKGCGKQNSDINKKVNIEYISANPTGPMHVGHGRWAALGDSISKIMRHAGYDVYEEFYMNDHGVQMKLFAKSISIRYLQMLGQNIKLPDDCYGGEYVRDIASSIIDKDGDKWLNFSEQERLDAFKVIGQEKMVKLLQKTLKQFGTNFDLYFSESSLYDGDFTKVDKAIEEFKRQDLIYDKDGATWFKSTLFGDDKDRVIIKENGEVTYFLSDCAYHFDKLQRGFEHLIDIWGADHHGYIPRMKAMMQAWGQKPESLEIVLGQLVNLFRDGNPVRMSKRTGDMVTFQELIDEVGVDATRYLMLSRNSDQPIDFDIEVAKKQDSSNPVYYVQYAHARICSIIKKVGKVPQDVDLSLLSDKYELDLCRLMDTLPEVINKAANQRAPHILVHYSQDLASTFHQFYTNCRVANDDKNLQNARLALCDAARIVLELTLSLLGVSAPTSM